MAKKYLGWQGSGNTIRGINKGYFIEISSKNKLYKDIIVRALLKASPNLSGSESWASPMEGNSLDDKKPILSSLAQNGLLDKLTGTNLKGKTLISLESSIQVWKGSEPLTLSLELFFKAYTNSKLEVEDPIKMLNLMSVPYLGKGVVLGGISKLKDKDVADISGYAPSDINIKYFDTKYHNLYKIESIEENGDGALKLDKNKNRIEQTINLSLGSKQSITRTKDGRNFVIHK